MPAQDINWKWVGLATILAVLLVGGLFVWNGKGGDSNLNAGAASATSVPDRTTTTIATTQLTQPPIAGEPSVATPAPAVSAATAPSTTPTTVAAPAKPTPVTTAALVFKPPTIGAVRATDCQLVSGPGPKLATVEWVAQVTGGSNWRAPSATKRQAIYSVGSGQAWDLWFTTTTPVPPPGQIMGFPTSINFASTVPADSTVRAVPGPPVAVGIPCR